MSIKLFVKKVIETLAFFTFLLIQQFNAFFSLHLIKIFPMTHNFWKKNFAKHWLTVVKQDKIAKMYRKQLNQIAKFVMVDL